MHDHHISCSPREIQHLIKPKIHDPIGAKSVGMVSFKSDWLRFVLSLVCPSFQYSSWHFKTRTITNSDLNRPCFAWHPYGKSGLFKTELVIDRISGFCRYLIGVVFHLEVSVFCHTNKNLIQVRWKHMHAKDTSWYLPLWIRLATSWHVMTCHPMSPCSIERHLMTFDDIWIVALE